jgi:hypothetical protein
MGCYETMKKVVLYASLKLKFDLAGETSRCDVVKQ